MQTEEGNVDQKIEDRRWFGGTTNPMPRGPIAVPVVEVESSLQIAGSIAVVDSPGWGLGRPARSSCCLGDPVVPRRQLHP